MSRAAERRVSRSHGFISDGESFTTIDAPGASFTYPLGINNAGQISGWFPTPYPHGLLYHGFLYNGGSFTTIDVPGAEGSTAAWPSTMSAKSLADLPTDPGPLTHFSTWPVRLRR